MGQNDVLLIDLFPEPVANVGCQRGGGALSVCKGDTRRVRRIIEQQSKIAGEGIGHRNEMWAAAAL